MGFIVARPLKSNVGSWLLEHERYVAVISRQQVSSLFPKHPPYVTSGYWDDVALAGLLAGERRELLVLGAGIGSFLPLLLACTRGCRVICVEFDSDIAAIGRRLAESVLGATAREALQWLDTDVRELPEQVLLRPGAVFIDIYNPDGISMLSLDPFLHRALSTRTGERDWVILNVSDQIFGQKTVSPTEAFVARLSPYYASILVLRRSASSTIVCSTRLDEAAAQGAIQDALMLAPGIWPTSFSSPIDGKGLLAGRREDSSGFDPRLLLFDAQRSMMGEQARIGDGLIEQALQEISALTPFELVRLSRRCSSLFGQEVSF